MRQHPYLRAYMAGIAVPTPLLLVILVVFAVGLQARQLERVIVFPMAVVPNVWGLWNVLRLAVGPRMRLPLGVHGALLPLVLMPAGALLAGALEIPIPWRFALPMVPVAMTAYYLAWKYLVGFLNRELGIL